MEIVQAVFKKTGCSIAQSGADPFLECKWHKDTVIPSVVTAVPQGGPNLLLQVRHWGVLQ